MESRTDKRLYIYGGEIADGTGGPLYRADLFIEKGRIVEVRPRDPRAAPGLGSSGGRGATSSQGEERQDDAQLIDAGGLVIAPGFIDVHSHADNAPLLSDDDTSKILQGVTTEVVGNCGFSLGPAIAPRMSELSRLLGRIFPAETPTFTAVADLFAATDAAGYVTNYVPLIGHNTLRIAAMGMEARTAVREEVATMQRLLEAGLDAGAFGLSSGLIYPPGIFAETAELVELARVLRHGGIYATHMRNEGSRLLASVGEALEIGRKAHCRVEISHLKSSGRANHGQVSGALGLLERARDAGLFVAADVYPYAASSTMLTACLPPSAQEGGDEALLARLSDRALRQEMRQTIEDPRDTSFENTIAGVGYEGIRIASTASHSYEGETLAEIAGKMGVPPFEAMAALLLEESLRVAVTIFSMAEVDVATVLRHPLTMIGSDGLPPGVGGKPHPRLYGTFPRVLGRYVRDEKILSLPEAVAKMTSIPADAFGLADRGRIRQGAVADLVGFSPATIADAGTYTDPVADPLGISFVTEAGVVVVSDGCFCGSRRGQRLRPAGI
jgi:N-acyl-D-amino-acid deacylase